jgi:hypothetical protein
VIHAFQKEALNMEKRIVVELSRPGAGIQRFTVCMPGKPSRCRLCGKQVSAAVAPGGSRIHVDPEPDGYGLYTARFLTCPARRRNRPAVRSPNERNRA